MLVYKSFTETCFDIEAQSFCKGHRRHRLNECFVHSTSCFSYLNLFSIVPDHLAATKRSIS